MKIVRLVSEYPVKDSEVKLSIIVGDSQIGGHVVRLGKKRLALSREITNLELGKGSDIKGKTLKIKSVVSDISDKTNKTSITYKLKGGVSPKTYSISENVENDGDAIIYRAEIKFT